MNENAFNTLLRLLLKKVVIIPNEVLIPYKKDAYEIVKDIDKNDVIFIACALAYPNSIIWSDDSKLKRQPKVRIINTREIIKLIGEKGEFWFL